MAESLLERLHEDGHDVGQAALKPLRDWFAQTTVYMDAPSTPSNA